ncbi:MAG: murein biosynthesis integral membrane protein MurJ [Candidatus Omnitrophica bacterium]|nr:murein biosynthesis integral membrane protein MurJ [Candidatus Omnitrophota bacterium]
MKEPVFYKKEFEMSTHRHLARSAGIIGVLTGVSRVLGFVRDLVIAAAFGTGVNAEAFVVSFRIPNTLRDLVGEGAANAALVPVLTEAWEKKRHEFWTLVSTFFYLLVMALALLCLAGVLFAPQVVALLAPGFLSSSDPDKFPLAVRLTRVLFPYIFLISLSALAMGVLNALKEFTSSALGPALLNVCMILAGIFFEKTYGPFALAFGVLAGGVLQLSFQVRPLLAKGFHFSKPSFRHPAVAQMGRLLLPRALGSALYQINVFVDSILASFESFVGTGGQSALYYSNRLFQLPLAVFGIALSQAILPTFSAQAVNGEISRLKETLSLALRSLALAVVPASVGLVVLSRPIVRIIFQHGRFDAASTAITSNALFFYAFGLLSCCFIKILVNAFYAMRDTRTPVKAMAVAVFLNVALSLILMRPLKIGGLTLASSLSATVNAALLFIALRKKIGPLDEKKILSSLLKIAAAALLMGAAAWFYDRAVLGAHLSDSRLGQSLYLLTGILLALAVYFAAAFALKIEELKKLFFRD